MLDRHDDEDNNDEEIKQSYFETIRLNNNYKRVLRE